MEKSEIGGGDGERGDGGVGCGGGLISESDNNFIKIITLME